MNTVFFIIHKQLNCYATIITGVAKKNLEKVGQREEKIGGRQEIPGRITAGDFPIIS
jgi:hypothetical protein